MILNPGRGQNIKYLPYAFTEHGAIQAANILNSPRAVEMGVYVVRAFVKLRELLASNKELARQFRELEARLEKKLAAHDEAIAAILSAIRQLMNPPPPKRRGSDSRQTSGKSRNTASISVVRFGIGAPPSRASSNAMRQKSRLK